MPKLTSTGRESALKRYEKVCAPSLAMLHTEIEDSHKVHSLLQEQAIARHHARTALFYAQYQKAIGVKHAKG